MCVKLWNCSREFGFFIIAVGEFFSFRPDWHQDNRAKPLVQQYLIALDSRLQSHPELQGCVGSCVAAGFGFSRIPGTPAAGTCVVRSAAESTIAGSVLANGVPPTIKRPRASEEETSQCPPETRLPSRPLSAAAPPPPPPPPPATPAAHCRTSAGGMPEKAELRLEGVVLDESRLTQLAPAAVRADGREPDRRHRTRSPGVSCLLRRRLETTQHRLAEKGGLRSGLSASAPALGGVG